MVRTLIAFAIILNASVVLAQSVSSEDDVTRYNFYRVEEGYLRLDLRTGQVSLCSRLALSWACQAVPDDRSALDNEIARLQSENAVLKKALLEQGLPLPGGIKDTSRDARGTAFKLLDHAQIERMMATVERVWRRFIGMLMNLQKDLLKGT